MHREQQIIDAAAAAIAAQSDVAASVFTNRVLSLGADDQELPAIVVTGGEDSALDDDGAVNLAYVDSLLALHVTCYAQESTEQELRTTLARLRSVVHRALLGTDRTLGLSFVIDTRYGGASDVSVAADVAPLGASRVNLFAVHYRMNLASPE